MEAKINNASTLNSVFEGFSETGKCLSLSIGEDKWAIETPDLGMLREDILSVADEWHGSPLAILRLIEGQKPSFEIDGTPAQADKPHLPCSCRQCKHYHRVE